MTKLKYENQGGRGFYTFHPFSNIEPKIQKEEKKTAKNELLFKGVIADGKKMKNSSWTREDLNYKKIKLGFAIKILLKLVFNNDIRRILRKMKKEESLFLRVKNKIDSNYKNISTAALKITLEENKDIYK